MTGVLGEEVRVAGTGISTEPVAGARETGGLEALRWPTPWDQPHHSQLCILRRLLWLSVLDSMRLS